MASESGYRAIVAQSCELGKWCFEDGERLPCVECSDVCFEPRPWRALASSYGSWSYRTSKRCESLHAPASVDIAGVRCTTAWGVHERAGHQCGRELGGRWGSAVVSVDVYQVVRCLYPYRSGAPLAAASCRCCRCRVPIIPRSPESLLLPPLRCEEGKDGMGRRQASEE